MELSNLTALTFFVLSCFVLFVCCVFVCLFVRFRLACLLVEDLRCGACFLHLFSFVCSVVCLFVCLFKTCVFVLLKSASTVHTGPDCFLCLLMFVCFVCWLKTYWPEPALPKKESGALGHFVCLVVC